MAFETDPYYISSILSPGKGGRGIQSTDAFVFRLGIISQEYKAIVAILCQLHMIEFHCSCVIIFKINGGRDCFLKFHNGGFFSFRHLLPEVILLLE